MIYSATITSASLRLRESRIIADLLIQGLSRENWKEALLEQNDNPTETEVRYWLAGNLCRCTGYDKIVRAVLDTAAEMRGAYDA